MKQGILLKLECPSCGNILKVKEIMISKGKKITIDTDISCPCGRKDKFKLLDFSPLGIEFIDEKEIEVKENEN